MLNIIVTIIDGKDTLYNKTIADYWGITTTFSTVATLHFQCTFPNFSFCLNEPHQRKWKYFHPLGIFSFKDLSTTYWRPAHYLNDPFSITKQLCHWQLRHHTSDLASPAVKFDWSLVIYCECRQGQIRLLGSLGTDTCFKFTIAWYQMTADSLDLKDGRSAFYSP